MADYELTKVEDDIESLKSISTIISRISGRIIDVRDNARSAADCESLAHISDNHSELINTIRGFVAWKLEEKHEGASSSLSSAISELSYKKKCLEIEEREYKSLYGEN